MENFVEANKIASFETTTMESVKVGDFINLENPRTFDEFSFFARVIEIDREKMEITITEDEDTDTFEFANTMEVNIAKF